MGPDFPPQGLSVLKKLDEFERKGVMAVMPQARMKKVGVVL